MISEDEYLELVQSLIEEGLSEESAKKVIERSKDDGLLNLQLYKLN